MLPTIVPRRNLSSSQISVAAEAFVAAQFALSGFDLLEQSSCSRYTFDLAVARAGGMMKVSVHASFNGFWDLVDRYMSSTRGGGTAADYHRAIDIWQEHHSSRVTCCLVQFEPADLYRMPQLFLAAPAEVAAQLHEKIDRLSSQEMVMDGLDVVHRLPGLPAQWRFSQARIAELMEMPAEETSYIPQMAPTRIRKECAEPQLVSSVTNLTMMN